MKCDMCSQALDAQIEFLNQELANFRRNAEHANREHARKLEELTKDRDGWKREFDMYRSAWIRELGEHIRWKHHDIDMLVVSTRDLRKRAETLTTERDELFEENKKLRAASTSKAYS